MCFVGLFWLIKMAFPEAGENNPVAGEREKERENAKTELRERADSEVEFKKIEGEKK